MLLAVSAGLIFAGCANAMAKASDSAPPFVQYRQTIHETAKVLRVDKTFSYQMLRRTADGHARWTLDSGATGVFTQSKLVPPTFDALSDFAIHGQAYSNGSFDMWTADVHPLTYTTTRKDVDVVTIAVKHYVTELAPDSTEEVAHIHMSPVGDDTPILPRLFFKDVWCDRTTNLLRRAEFVGPEERVFTIDYGIEQGRLVVTHLLFAQTYSRAAGIVRARLTMEAEYDRFAFPETVPASTFERAPGPAESPVAAIRRLR